MREKEYVRDRSINKVLFLCMLVSGFLAYRNFYEQPSQAYYYIALFLITFLSHFFYELYRQAHFQCPDCGGNCRVASRHARDERRVWVQTKFACHNCGVTYDTKEKADIKRRQDL